MRSPKKPKKEEVTAEDGGEVEGRVDDADLDNKVEDTKPLPIESVTVVVKRKKEVKEKVIASGNRSSKRLKKEESN